MKFFNSGSTLQSGIMFVFNHLCPYCMVYNCSIDGHFTSGGKLFVLQWLQRFLHN